MRLRQCYAYSVRIASRGSNVTRIVCETHMRFLRGHFGVSLGSVGPLGFNLVDFCRFWGALGTRFSTGLSTMTQKSVKSSLGNCYFRVWGTFERFGVIFGRLYPSTNQAFPLGGREGHFLTILSDFE